MDRGHVQAFYSRATAQLATLPAVTGVTMASSLPISGGEGNGDLTIEGRPAAPGELGAVTTRRTALNYFQVMGVALAGPATAQKLVPFSGWVHGTENDVFQPPPPGSLFVDASLTGIATQLGLFTLKYQLTVKLPDGTATGSGQLIAANGDSISATIVGTSTLTDTPGVASIMEIYTITGGTGRFAGAKGSLKLRRLVELATGVTAGSFDGAITSPAAAH